MDTPIEKCDICFKKHQQIIAPRKFHVQWRNKSVSYIWHPCALPAKFKRSENKLHWNPAAVLFFISFEIKKSEICPLLFLTYDTFTFFGIYTRVLEGLKKKISCLCNIFRTRFSFTCRKWQQVNTTTLKLETPLSIWKHPWFLWESGVYICVYSFPEASLIDSSPAICI